MSKEGVDGGGNGKEPSGRVLLNVDTGPKDPETSFVFKVADEDDIDEAYQQHIPCKARSFTLQFDSIYDDLAVAAETAVRSFNSSTSRCGKNAGRATSGCGKQAQNAVGIKADCCSASNNDQVKQKKLESVPPKESQLNLDANRASWDTTDFMNYPSASGSSVDSQEESTESWGEDTERGDTFSCFVRRAKRDVRRFLLETESNDTETMFTSTTAALSVRSSFSRDDGLSSILSPRSSVFSPRSSGAPTPRASRTPKAAMTPRSARTPRTTQTPRATRTPRAARTPSGARTPRATRTPRVARTRTPRHDRMQRVKKRQPKASTTPRVATTPKAAPTPKLASTLVAPESPSVASFSVALPTPTLAPTPRWASPKAESTDKYSALLESVSDQPVILGREKEIGDGFLVRTRSNPGSSTSIARVAGFLHRSRSLESADLAKVAAAMNRKKIHLRMRMQMAATKQKNTTIVAGETCAGSSQSRTSSDDKDNSESGSRSDTDSGSDTYSDSSGESNRGATTTSNKNQGKSANKIVLSSKTLAAILEERESEDTSEVASIEVEESESVLAVPVPLKSASRAMNYEPRAQSIKSGETMISESEVEQVPKENQQINRHKTKRGAKQPSSIEPSKSKTHDVVAPVDTVESANKPKLKKKSSIRNKLTKLCKKLKRNGTKRSEEDEMMRQPTRSLTTAASDIAEVLDCYSYPIYEEPVLREPGDLIESVPNEVGIEAMDERLLLIEGTASETKETSIEVNISSHCLDRTTITTTQDCIEVTAEAINDFFTPEDLMNRTKSHPASSNDVASAEISQESQEEEKENRRKSLPKTRSSPLFPFRQQHNNKNTVKGRRDEAVKKSVDPYDGPPADETFVTCSSTGDQVELHVSSSSTGMDQYDDESLPKVKRPRLRRWGSRFRQRTASLLGRKRSTDLNGMSTSSSLIEDDPVEEEEEEEILPCDHWTYENEEEEDEIFLDHVLGSDSCAGDEMSDSDSMSFSFSSQMKKLSMLQVISAIHEELKRLEEEGHPTQVVSL